MRRSHSSVARFSRVVQNLTIIALDEVLNLPPTIGAFATEEAASVAGALTTVGLVEPLEAAVGVSFRSLASRLPPIDLERPLAEPAPLHHL